MMVLLDAALGPDFGPSHGALTATEALTALVAFASAAVHVAAAFAEPLIVTIEVAESATTAEMARARFLIAFTFLLYWY